MRLTFPALLVSLVLTLAAGGRAEEPSADFYVRQVKPLLKQKCFACHGALKQEGGLRLDTAAAALRGGDSGPAVVVGQPDASSLIERVTADHESIRMPQEAAPLAAEAIGHLRQWIVAGASAPPDEKPEPDPQAHWAFQPPRTPALPASSFGPCSQPIDFLVDELLLQQGLTPVPVAERAVLLRRVYLDLIGLPPTPDELHAFLADDSPDALERVVDRLLAFPQYGERWARHWMDVWRYSDWYGRRSVPDVMNSYPQIWRWRDWIVRSLNADKGYDQMVVEMLAADELWPDDQDKVVATGFIVRNWFKWNYDTWMRDQVEHTGKAFLGLTLQCALCHDHKYDPISQEEYFRFRAIFEPLELRHDRMPGEPDPGNFQKYVYAKSYGPIASGLIRVFDEKLDAETFMYRGGDQRNKFEGKPAVSPGVPAFLGGDRFTVQPIDLPPTAYYPGLRSFVLDEERAVRQTAIVNAQAAVAAAKTALETMADDVTRASLIVAEAKLTAAQDERTALDARIAADRARCGLSSGDADALAKTASRAERQTKIAAAQVNVTAAQLAVAQAEALPADEKRQPAMDAANKTLAAAQQSLATVTAALDTESTEYSPLSPTYPKQTTGRRAALARWITARENPLTARVAVNHIWRWHFSRPLVETTANFGRNGKPPSHPALLDWLAVEMMDHGWSLKHLHRQLVTSDVYRRSSDAPHDHPSLAVDPDNHYFWRFSRQRMEAEVLRDSVLSVAGELDRTLGGKEIDHALGLTSRRRSLYFAHHGEGKMELLETFDGASPIDCYERTTSIRPQQALAMANNELTRQASGQLAERLSKSLEPGGNAHPPADEAFVLAAFERVLSRPPNTAEAAAAVAFLRKATSAEQGRASLVHVLLNHNDFLMVR